MYGPSGSGSGSTAGSFAPASSSESICSAFSSVSWPTPTPWFCCRTVFFWRGYKWFKTFRAEHWNLCLQVAELDTYAGDIRSKTRELQTTAAQLRNDVASVETSQGMLSDMVIQFTLVWWKWAAMQGCPNCLLSRGDTCTLRREATSQPRGQWDNRNSFKLTKPESPK